MKELLYFIVSILTFRTAAQSFPLKNVNDQYFSSSFYKSDISKNELHESVRDKAGLYWFQYLTEVRSFDGVNWKSYDLSSISKNPFRINDIAATDDGNTWLATEYGIYVFDATTQKFVSAKERFPGMHNAPTAVTCLLDGPPGKLVFLAFQLEGFYIIDLKSKGFQHISIDGSSRISTRGSQVVIDKAGTIWGTTEDFKGIWNYDPVTKLMRCSWKGQLPAFEHKRFKNFVNLTFSQKKNVLWIAHVNKRYLEKMDLQTLKSDFYSFSGKLEVRPDTNTVDRYMPFMVKTDRDNNEWINVSGKYLVKLNDDIARMEFLTDESRSFPIGMFEMFSIEKGKTHESDDILFWVVGYEKLSIIKKDNSIIKHVYYDTSSISIKPSDYLQNEESRINQFLEKGRDGRYYLLQKDAGRPKLICFEKDFRVKTIVLNNDWKQYPAYFSRDFDPDTFFVALLKPGIAPLDFRHAVVKDFRVDLNTFRVDEIKPDFKHRVRYYGVADNDDVFWLYSNGHLYSYDTRKDKLDSLFICDPATRKGSPVNLVKGTDYPTLLHRPSSTFWISFYPNRELYKVDLKSRRIQRILKTCPESSDCVIPGTVMNLYSFDSTKIYFKSGLFSMLFDTRTDKVIELSTIFKKGVPIGIPRGPVGSGIYGNWIVFAVPSQINLYNTQTGTLRVLLLGEDFKWPLAIYNSRPLANDRGEMIFMTAGVNQGFLVMHPDSAVTRRKPGTVHYSFVKLDNRDLPVDSLMGAGGLTVKYNRYNNIQTAFSDYSVFNSNRSSYQYALYKGGDTVWNTINEKPEVTLSDLSPGKYQLLVRAANVYEDYSERVNALKITVLPPYWQTWWFRGLMILLVLLLVYGLYRYRLKQITKLQRIRNNIASDLHDDIGSTLNSISIYSEVAKQQAGKEIPALDLIGMNSRKIIESMSDIVWTINPENDSFEKIIVRMRSFAHQLFKAKKVEYAFEADDKLNSIALPMQVRKNFYLVFKEAITNIMKYSEATRVSISLGEINKTILLVIRDNGRGLPANAETIGNGLLNMKRRAEEIHASLTIHSSQTEGTGIELMLRT
jgi:two-component sensor histidine kinase